MNKKYRNTKKIKKKKEKKGKAPLLYKLCSKQQPQFIKFVPPSYRVKTKKKDRGSKSK